MTAKKNKKSSSSFGAAYHDGMRLPERPLDGKIARNTDAFNMSFFEDVLARDPDNLDALTYLGHAYTARKEYEKGFAIDQKLAALNPKNGLVLYNLACSCSLLGKIDKAVVALQKSFELGYNDLDFLKKDPDLENLRKNPVFNELLESLKKKID